jgi:hypothetical protein
MQRKGHGCGAAGKTQFEQDIVDVHFDGGWAVNQFSGNLGIVQSIDHQGQDFPLALCQIQNWF